ncbi:MAG: c-type cytochrome [Candidatus Rokuibacteriota bacterium]
MIKGLLLMLLLAAGVEAEDGALVARGKGLFRDQGCYGCHTVGATGTPIATDLSRIGAKHDEAYLGRWLRDPSQQKPRQHMPKLQLTEAEVQALSAYLASLR